MIVMALYFSSIGARQFSKLKLDIWIEADTTSCINDHILAAYDKLKTLAEESMTEERTNLKTVPNAVFMTLAVMAGTILNLEMPLTTSNTNCIYCD